MFHFELPSFHSAWQQKGMLFHWKKSFLLIFSNLTISSVKRCVFFARMLALEWKRKAFICAARDSKLAPRSKKKNSAKIDTPFYWMGQFFILRSRKFVNWNSPLFLKRYFFIFRLDTSNKCFFIIIRSTFPVHVDTMRLIMTQNLSPRTEPRS